MTIVADAASLKPRTVRVPRGRRARPSLPT
jgi:lysozyme family protein